MGVGHDVKQCQNLGPADWCALESSWERTGSVKGEYSQSQRDSRIGGGVANTRIELDMSKEAACFFCISYLLSGHWQ